MNRECEGLCELSLDKGFDEGSEFESESEHAAQVKRDETVNTRPSEMCDDIGIAFERAVSNRLGHRCLHDEPAAGVFETLRIRSRVLVEFKDDPIGVRLAEREVYVGVAHGAKARAVLRFALHGGIKRIAEARARCGTDGVEDLPLVGEVAIRGHRAASDFLGEGPHGDAPVAVSREELRCGGAERVAEVVQLVLGKGIAGHVSLFTM